MTEGKMRILIFIILFSLTSCSSYKAYNHISESKNNSFIDYSILRSSPDLIHTVIKKEEVITNALYICYQQKSDRVLKNFLTNMNPQNDHLPIWNALSNCNQEIGNFQLARHYLRLSMGTVKDKKTKSNLLQNYAILLARKGLRSEAIKFINESLRLKYSSLASYNKALILLKDNQYRHAYKILSSLNKINKKDIDIIANLAYSLVQLNRNQDVINLLKGTPDLYLKRTDLNVFYSFALFQKGFLNKAIKIIRMSTPERENEKQLISNLETKIEESIKLKSTVEKKKDRITL